MRNNKIQKGNVREAALLMLVKIDQNQAYSHLLLDQTIKKQVLKSIDTPLLTELVYGTVSHQRLLDYYLQHFLKKPVDTLEKWVVHLLRMSIYQLVFLDRVPDRAVIFEAVEIAKRHGHKGIANMVNGILRSFTRQGPPAVELIEEPAERLSIEFSHPLWLVELWIEQYGFEQTKKIVKENQTRPTFSVRVNPLTLSREEASRQFENEGIESERSELYEHALKIKRGSVANSALYNKGLVSIQDVGSMIVSKVVDPQKGEKVLDACAAPGGKTTHLSELMENTGEVISLDIHAHKIKSIDDYATRLGLTNITAKQCDAREVKNEFEEKTFDKILVDAPCSGLGVIQHKPDVKWRKRSSDLSNLAHIQLDILHSVWPLLKRGGRLVYSTCTINKNENEKVIDSFLETITDAKRDTSFQSRLPEVIKSNISAESSQIQLFPGDYGTDGFFISSIIKNEK